MLLMLLMLFSYLQQKSKQDWCCWCTAGGCCFASIIYLAEITKGLVCKSTAIKNTSYAKITGGSDRRTARNCCKCCFASLPSFAEITRGVALIGVLPEMVVNVHLLVYHLLRK